MNLSDLKWVTVELLLPATLEWQHEGARHAASESAHAQAALFSKLLATPNNVLRGRSQFLNAVAEITSGLSSELSTKITISQKQDGAIYLESPMPVLSETEVANWTTIMDRHIRDLIGPQQFEICLFIVAAVVFEMTRSGKLTLRLTTENHLSLMGFVAEYATMKTQKAVHDDRSHILLESLNTLQSQSISAFDEIKIQRESFTKIEAEYRDSLFDLQKGIGAASVELATVSKHLEGVDGRFNDTIDRLTEASSKSIDELKTDAEKRLADHATSTEQRLNLKQVTQRWQDVKRRAKQTLIASGVVIVSMIFVAILVVLFCAQNVLDFLTPLNLKTVVFQSTVSGALSMQIGRIAILAIPIVSYFWLVKIAVRMFLRSLALMDDADQRATIMESYYTLTGDGMTDQRALPMMLWAIFRPLPGHGPDGIEPPDFTEAINAGLKGKGLDLK